MHLRTNGTGHPMSTPKNLAREIAWEVTTPEAAIAAQVAALPVGGVVTFPTKNVADAGGKTEIFVARDA